ncbi:MAG: hypothetical protein ACOCRK_03465 [bacterium]
MKNQTNVTTGNYNKERVNLVSSKEIFKQDLGLEIQDMPKEKMDLIIDLYKDKKMTTKHLYALLKGCLISVKQKKRIHGIWKGIYGAAGEDGLCSICLNGVDEYESEIIIDNVCHEEGLTAIYNDSKNFSCTYFMQESDYQKENFINRTYYSKTNSEPIGILMRWDKNTYLVVGLGYIEDFVDEEVIILKVKKNYNNLAI